jgi:hypothetical protein
VSEDMTLALKTGVQTERIEGMSSVKNSSAIKYFLTPASL